MVRIRRDKGGSTHYAAAVAPRGNVTAWTHDPGRAAPLSEQVARAVVAFYGEPERREAAGVITPELLDGTPAELAALVVGDDGVTRVQFEELQRAYRKAVADGQELQGANATLAQRAATAEQDRDRAEQKLAVLDGRLNDQQAEIRRMREYIAELEERCGERPESGTDEQGQAELVTVGPAQGRRGKRR